MKVLSLFSGIGAFEKALDVLEIPYELVGYCEIDKYASKSYSAIHDVPETMNLGDITKIDEKALPKDIDLITYGFPCQDISLAGKQKGLFNEDGSQTRSGLFFEALRIIEETQPRVAIAENVKNLTGKKFNAQFQIVLNSLEEAGYNNYWQVLNAKNYGIPQNRERVFIVSIRKDIDTGAFKFPKPFPLELRLKDMLEDEVDEKFYLSSVRIQNLITHKERNAKKGNGFGAKFVAANDVSCSLTTSPEKSSGQYLIEEPVIVEDAKPIKLGFFKYPNSDKAHQSNTFYDANGVSPTLDTCTGGNRQVKSAYPAAYDEQNRYIRKDDCIGSLTTDGSSPKHNNRVVQQDLRIRKLTPKECFRLMGFTDEDFAKAEAVNSNTQLYKQAGNSIVVDVIAHIFTQLKNII